MLNFFELLMLTPPGELQNAAAKLDGARTDLRQACSEDRVEMARTALAAGAEPDLIDRFGETPLGTAASRGSLGVACELLAAGAPVDQRGQRGWTPLLRVLGSMPHGTEDMCKALLAAGAQPTLRAYDATEALTPYNPDDGDGDDDVSPMASMLADPQDGFDGDDAMCVALANSMSQAADVSDILRNLIASGADINASNREGVTPLMVAAISGRETELNFLLAAGADPMVRDINGADALARALVGGNEVLAPFLLKAGADPRILCPGLQGLSSWKWSLAEHAEDWLVKALGDKKAELDAQDEASAIKQALSSPQSEMGRKAPRI